MTRTDLVPWTVGLALALAPVVPAQDESPASRPSPKELHETLERDTRAAMDAFRREQKRLVEENAKNGTQHAIPMRPDLGDLVLRAEQAAETYAGTEDAVPFLVWTVRFAANRDATGAAIETLLTDHVASPGLASVAGHLGHLHAFVRDEEKRTAMLRRLEDESPLASIRGWAMLARLGPTIDSADQDSEEYRNARRDLIAIAEQAEDSHLDGEIRGRIALREKLGVGNVAPDIAGTDLDGVDFRLRDYQGKVVFLDFWGDW